ncbi:hypothetical protein BJV82DRAFT_632241 [Fennellomyces sp. T-0311]|nr:hypothetical protein BJV82DRAFT_632241 [Fennellomyces sp. T-0311]
MTIPVAMANLVMNIKVMKVQFKKLTTSTTVRLMTVMVKAMGNQVPHTPPAQVRHYLLNRWLSMAFREKILGIQVVKVSVKRVEMMKMTVI